MSIPITEKTDEEKMRNNRARIKELNTPRSLNEENPTTIKFFSLRSLSLTFICYYTAYDNEDTNISADRPLWTTELRVILSNVATCLLYGLILY